MESFFSIALAYDSEVEILEFIYRRYAQADSVLKLPIVAFNGLVQRGKEVEEDERLHRQWVSMLPQMSLGQLKYMSFEEYKNKCLGKNIDLRPNEAIIAELEELHGMKLV